VGNLS